MSADHTPGRLTLVTQYAQPELRDASGELVAVVADYEVADASRLAACWNACDGVSTEHLEDDAVRKLIQDRNLLLAQRDELLALLRIVRGKHGCGALTLPYADVERIDAAIAKAGGAA